MRVIRNQAVQVHPVPTTIVDPKGPFPRELFDGPEVITDYEPAENEDGSNLPLGATAQNNFNPPKYLRCARCFARVLESETKDHKCED